MYNYFVCKIADISDVCNRFIRTDNIFLPHRSVQGIFQEAAVFPVLPQIHGNH